MYEWSWRNWERRNSDDPPFQPEHSFTVRSAGEGEKNNLPPFTLFKPAFKINCSPSGTYAVIRGSANQWCLTKELFWNDLRLTDSAEKKGYHCQVGQASDSLQKTFALTAEKLHGFSASCYFHSPGCLTPRRHESATFPHVIYQYT